MTGRIRGKSKAAPIKGWKHKNDKAMREAKALWMESKRVCRLSNGCHSPVYQCQNCPYRGVVEVRGFGDNGKVVLPAGIVE
jgi:hypothetical protein